MPGHASVFYLILWPLAAMRGRGGRGGLFGREENLAVAEAGGYIFVAELRIERKKISIHKPYVLGWEEGDVYTYTMTEEIEGYEQYIGWHVIFYVNKIYSEDWYVHGIKDEVADAYFFLMKDKL